MQTQLKNKAALITGGGAGIGRAIALALAREGANIVIADLEPAARTIDEIQATGVRCLGLTVDVSQEAQVIGMVSQAIDAFGALDLYVNNAAASWPESVTRLTADNWSKTIATNLSSCVFACREVARHMIERRSGSILIIGSTAMWMPAYDEASYRVSKTGLRSYMEVLAIELAPFGVRVNMLTPGHVPTRLTSGLSDERARKLISEIPLRRFGNTDELGPAAVLLLSDALSPYTTGAELVVDGGLKLRPIPLRSDEEIRQSNL